MSTFCSEASKLSTSTFFNEAPCPLYRGSIADLGRMAQAVADPVVGLESGLLMPARREVPAMVTETVARLEALSLA